MPTERGFKVLECIVDEYIKTGEPIGSKLLARRLEEQSVKVSPATIRNEMAFLEQSGYLEQPHTSAGRTPTVKGYRLYIERLLPESRSALSEADRCVIDSAVRGICGDTDEMIIENAGNALAELTKCAVVSTNNINRFSVITKVEVIPAGKRVYVLLLVTSGGGIKNRVCRLSFDLGEEQLAFFSKFANENLSGVNLDRLSQEYIEQIGVALGSYMVSLSPLLKAVADLSEEMSGAKFKFEGQNNLIAFEDLQKGEVLAILENSGAFGELLNNAFSEISVILGEEKPGTFAVSNSGLIAGSFQKHGQAAGSFGVIGPMRLDYKKLIPYVDYFAVEVTKLLSGESRDLLDG
jgi:heat-inducible transcriptional repressor